MDFVGRLKNHNNIKLLGLDIGRKKIGIAIWSTKIATPLKIIKRTNIRNDIESINKIADEFGIADLVVGIPLHNGIVQQSASYITQFANLLQGNKRIYFQDESFSSCEAIESLKRLDITRKKRDQIDDAVAACVILDDFMNMIDKITNESP